jgi:hypothetical protein
MSFLQLPKDNSAFMQVSVPNDFRAITTSSFMQLYVPTMITSIPYPTNMTAGLATSNSLFLLCNEDNSEIMTPILLLNYVKDVPAIMVATYANYMLQLIVMSIQRALIELIVDFISTSEGARAPLSKLIIGCGYSKISFHFCKDCRIFCEGVKDSTIGISSNNGLVGLIGLGLIGFIGFGLISLVSLSGINGLIRQIGLVSLVGLSGFGLISLIGLSLDGLIGHISLTGLICDIGFGLISLVGLSGFCLVGLSGIHCLIVQIGLTGFVGLSGFGLISLIDIIGFDLVGLSGIMTSSASTALSQP